MNDSKGSRVLIPEEKLVLGLVRDLHGEDISEIDIVFHDAINGESTAYLWLASGMINLSYYARLRREGATIAQLELQLGHESTP
jgi:hypothetical protein